MKNHDAQVTDALHNLEVQVDDVKQAFASYRMGLI